MSEFGGPLSRIVITDDMRARARDDAESRADHTSRRQDFHAGGRERVVEKFMLGNLGEAAFAAWAASWGIALEGRTNPHDRADLWDFRNAYVGAIDVKTRSAWAPREMLIREDRVRGVPCDAYVLVMIDGKPWSARSALIEGWATKTDVQCAPLKDSKPSADGRVQKNRAIDVDDLRPLIEFVEACTDTHA